MMGPKSSNFVKVDFPHSVDTVSGLLEVLKDPSKFEKNLAALKTYIEKANQTIATLGKAEDIDNMLASAKVAEEKSKAVIADAEAKAKDIITKAESRASELTDLAEKQVKDIREEAQRFQDHAQQLHNKALVESQKHSILLKEIESKHADIVAREEALKVGEKELARKKALLAQL